jgi:hypothetical protein
MHTHVAENQLRAALRGGALPDRGHGLHQGVHLRAVVILPGRNQPCIERELAAICCNRQGVIDARVHLLGAQPVIAFHELVLDGALRLQHRAGNDRGLAACEARAWRVQHLGRLHIGHGAEHLLQLRQVDEAREAAAGPEALAVRGNLHGLDDFPEGRGLGVEMIDAALGQPFGIEITLHGIHLDHGVADRRAGGKRQPVAGMEPVER